jgi:hypothetical protein
MSEDVSVIHLVWARLGVAPLERFVDSYRRHRAGIEHRLLVVFNGFGRDLPAAFRAALEGIDFEPLHLLEPRLDLAAYREAAEAASASRLCFLNSYSEPLADGWLNMLDKRLSAAAAGLAGATGSYEQSASSPLGRIFNRARLTPFPNPHVRSSSFMLSRELLLDLDWADVRKKATAWQLENGPRSITRQVWKRGLETLVVGRDGEAYPPDRWFESRTFRSGDQENLLIADNRTREYEEADPATRRWLTELAWGKDALGTAGRGRALGLRVRGRRRLARYARKARS